MVILRATSKIGLCGSCARARLAIPRSSPFRARFSSTSPPKRSRSWPYPLGLSLALLPPLLLWFSGTKPGLSPQIYSDHKVGSTSKVTPQHALVAIPVPPESLDLFSKDAVRKSGEQASDGEVVVQHIMVKSPDIQIERPYTPINDVSKDGEVRLVVKRVRGGEVGRLVHALKPGDEVGLRGPITTFSLDPTKYSKIVMISTGTAVAPFLQFMSKLDLEASLPKLHLLHLQPGVGKDDWTVNAGLLPSLQEKLQGRLVVERPPATYLARQWVAKAVESPSDVLVLVCLPPQLLDPLCGRMTPNLDQGPLTGVLGELGLKPEQVLKLE